MLIYHKLFYIIKITCLSITVYVQKDSKTTGKKFSEKERLV